ncbi:MAG: DUF1799 domain-containing protein [Betaproteobacteria bacterium]|nr:DUF1799 domain-containing protein [Betaproteobacteria bacterium]
MQTQWRDGFNGRTGLDYNPVIAMVRELDWPLVTTLEMLQTIEIVYLDGQRKKRESTRNERR